MTDTLPFANHKNEIERQIIVLLVEDILAAGYSIAVDNGLEEQQGLSGAAEVFAAMSTTDQDDLICRHNGEHTDTVRLIYGNDADVILDYTSGFGEHVFERAGALAAHFRGW